MVRVINYLAVWVRVVIIQDSASFSQTLLNVNKSLVTATSEEQICVTERLNEATINQDIDIRQKGSFILVLYNLFKSISRVAPYTFFALRLYYFCQFCKTFSLVHRVATCECDVAHVVR